MQKMKPQRLMILAAVLLVIYVGDSIYSTKYPNEGDGITEYSAEGKVENSFIIENDKELKLTERFLYS